VNKVGGKWQLQTAKARFSELFDMARRVGPQIVTRRGRDAVVVMAVEDYRRLIGRRPRSLAALIAASPLKEAALELTRANDPEREIDL